VNLDAEKSSPSRNAGQSKISGLSLISAVDYPCRISGVSSADKRIAQRGTDLARYIINLPDDDFAPLIRVAPSAVQDSRESILLAELWCKNQRLKNHKNSFQQY
jgi:hypothetical protein